MGKTVKDRDPFVSAADFDNLDAMIKQFMKRSLPIIKEAGSRMFYCRKPTRAARKRLGNRLERLRTREWQQEEKEKSAASLRLQRKDSGGEA
jgi:hypothetical protein